MIYSGNSVKEKVGYNLKLSKSNLMYFTAFAYIYFSFNSFLLPPGLSYSILLTPVLMLWLAKQKDVSLLKTLSIFFIVFLSFLTVHYFNGINVLVYIQSSLLYLTCVIFSLTFYSYINNYYFTFEAISYKLLRFNFYLVLIAILSYTVWKEGNIFWYSNEITSSLSFPRLRLLTTEASEYSLLFAPFFFFYFNYYYYLNLTKKRFWMFASMIFSLLLSLSYGFLGIAVITLTVFLIYNGFLNRRKKYNIRLLLIYSILVCLAIFMFLGPLRNSGFVSRIFSILSGSDTSSNGRSSDSYILAQYILSLKNDYWFGIGPGQLKLIGKNVIIDYYQYTDEVATKVVRIPCSIAELMVTFGYVGVIIKFFTEIYLFIKTKVSTSSFRFCMFFFMFFYQFVGSNTVYTIEYLIWILAFSNVFPDSYFKKLSS